MHLPHTAAGRISLGIVSPWRRVVVVDHPTQRPLGLLAPPCSTAGATASARLPGGRSVSGSTVAPGRCGQCLPAWRQRPSRCTGERPSFRTVFLPRSSFSTTYSVLVRMVAITCAELPSICSTSLLCSGRDLAPGREAVAVFAAVLQLALLVEQTALARPCVAQAVDDDRVVAGVLESADGIAVLLDRERRLEGDDVVVAQVGIEIAAAVLGVDQADLGAEAERELQRGVRLASARRSDQRQPQLRLPAFSLADDGPVLGMRAISFMMCAL